MLLQMVFGNCTELFSIRIAQGIMDNQDLGVLRFNACWMKCSTRDPGPIQAGFMTQKSRLKKGGFF